MHSLDGIAAIDAAFDRLDAALDRCAELSFDGLTVLELLALIARCDLLRAEAATACYRLTNPFTGNADLGPGT